MALIGAGTGLVKSELIDRPKANKQRKLSATQTELSPWTGRAGGPVDEADPWGAMLKGAGTGASMGLAMEKHASPSEFRQTMALNSMSNPYMVPRPMVMPEFDANRAYWGGAY
jgi:hypothetical protein